MVDRSLPPSMPCSARRQVPEGWIAIAHPGRGLVTVGLRMFLSNFRSIASPRGLGSPSGSRTRRFTLDPNSNILQS